MTGRDLGNAGIPPPPELSPRRAAIDRAVQTTLFGSLEWGALHWLALVNTASLVLFVLPVVVAPLLHSLGWDEAADTIFAIFKTMCHQRPDRSFYLFGEQMAICQRDLGIFGAFLLFGLLYLPLRRRLRSLPLWLAIAYCVPIAVDGFTQLFGWRESTWELRVVTGSFFALAAVWYSFPHLDLVTRAAAAQFRRERLALRA